MYCGMTRLSFFKINLEYFVVILRNKMENETKICIEIYLINN